MASIKAILFDWAGTTVDYGSRAPASVFVEIFRRRNIAISEAEARGPMGLAKRDHIAAVCRLDNVQEAWQQQYGRTPTEEDIDAMYEEFLPLQKETLASHSDVIPGVVETVAACRDRDIKIGSTTGYTRALMDVVVPLAAKQGYEPDAVVCSDEAKAGRPAPWMNLRALELLDVFPTAGVIAVDDTPVGIVAGKNTGAITVGITQSGNALGLSAAEIDQLSTAQLEEKLEIAAAPFREAGADYILRSVAQLPKLLDEIEGDQ